MATTLEQQMKRWICFVYNTRGLGLTDQHWEQFKAWAEANQLTDQPTPGKRKDGRDPWDVLEENL